MNQKRKHHKNNKKKSKKKPIENTTQENQVKTKADDEPALTMKQKFSEKARTQNKESAKDCSYNKDS